MYKSFILIYSFISMACAHDYEEEEEEEIWREDVDTVVI